MSPLILQPAPVEAVGNSTDTGEVTGKTGLGKAPEKLRAIEFDVKPSQ
jgi:hypothetical protein